MEYEHITCVLELTAIVCYGFLILAFALHWLNEANTYLLVFCLSNGMLAFVAAFQPKENNTFCHWNGLLTQLALTMGFDALYRGQVERRRMANHEFRLYPKRPLWKKVFRTVIVSVAVSFTAWNLFRHNPTFKMCFFKASNSADLEETMISFFWILFFYVRPVAMTIKLTPTVVSTCQRQIKVLAHERELGINGKLLLFKDYHRRLFHVIVSTVMQIIFLLWLTLTVPYVIQLISMVAGLNTAMRLDELSPWDASVLIYLYRSIPLVNCFLLITAFVVYFSFALKR